MKVVSAVRRYGISALGVGVTIVSPFFTRWDDGWTFALWATCMTLSSANVMNILKWSDQKRQADRWYAKFVEMRNEYYDYRTQFPAARPPCPPDRAFKRVD